MATRRSSNSQTKSTSKYGEAASKAVASAVKRQKAGTLESSSGDKVRTREQAIAIGLSEARAKGGKVPKPKK